GAELPVLALLLHLGADDHVLALAVHHIAFDGWSAGVLVRELEALYRSAVQGESAPLPPLGVQYGDWALWQRARASDALGYWREALQDAPVPSLPTDRPRGVRRGRGSRVGIAVDEGLRRGLRELCRREGVTLFMALHAALLVVLWRWSGERDVVVGTAASGRDREEVEGLIGFFVNTLALRARVEGDLSVSGLLARVRAVALGAYGHQEAPFERVVEALHPERRLDMSPLFSVMLVLQGDTPPPPALPGLAVSAVDVPVVSAPFDLTLSLGETPSGLAGELVYDADLYEAGTASRLASQFVGVLRALASSAGSQALWRLALLSGEERHRVVEGWNATAEAVSGESVVALFQAQARRAPAAVAVVCGEVSLSYGELEARADRLARRLRALGVGPERVVGLLLERSVALVVGVLGVLKAGAAFLPLDPAAPAARLSLLVADAGAALVVTRAGLAPLLAPGTAALVVDAPEEMQAPLPATPRAAPPLPQQLAYLIYTSGSTGAPKGVMLTHGGLANLALAHGRDCALGPGDRLLQLASPSFDVSVAELAMTLVAGATLVMAPDEELVPGEPLARLLREQRITHVMMVPSVLQRLPQEALAHCRVLVVGGEPCPPALVARHAAGRRMLNAYGPTEATVCATMSAPLTEAEAPPIGRPIANMRAYVLDDQLEPVGVGCVGELYLGGVGVARGYVGRAAQTAARFVADPFGVGGRLYRTGDLARWRGDGVLEFLGRGDDQVKLRGVRIELGEVEAALASHESVASAAAAVRDDRLVGYVVARAPVSAAALRAHAASLLPAALVPARVVVVDALPRTASGKLDRAALPAPARGAASAVPPQGAAEELLAGLWRELLGLATVGRHDNFFEQGGHSLLAMQLVSRVRRVFGVELGVRTLFEHAVLREMAAAVSGAAPAQPLTAASRGDRVPLSHGQQRLWFLSALESEGSSYTTVPLALRLEGGLDVAALERALLALVERHEALRTVYPSVDGVAVQQVVGAERFRLVREAVSAAALDGRLAALARHRFALGA
ncbi:MAG TPA: amino acid adenylation domain-containing protein, partial [Ktedonobacterales bacterium]|nr:amino acid adenylation domain-containing protein [Ktedonobacterales bacterium]